MPTLHSRWQPRTHDRSPEHVARVHELCASYRRLAYHLARRSYRLCAHTLPLEELESEALFALVKVANYFDPSRGTKFMTLAYLSIWRHLGQVVRRAERH